MAKSSSRATTAAAAAAVMASSGSAIVWPPCLSFVAVKEPTGFFSVFASPEVLVFSVSGGQVQYSTHPRLAGVAPRTARAVVSETSRAWALDDVAQLDGFAYDPRDPGCAAHANLNGGCLGAKVESRAGARGEEVTLTTTMAPAPLRLSFLAPTDCDAFKDLVARSAACCAQKFNAEVGRSLPAAADR